MLLKMGVDVSRLKRPIRRILNDVDRIYRNLTGREAVITSTYEGTHSPSSLHYANLAVDIRLPHTKVGEVLRAIKLAIGEDYDVVLEKDHIHIEYDPKRRKGNGKHGSS